MYASLARWCFRHARVVIGGWILLLLAVGGITASVGPAYDSSFEIPDSESSEGFEVLDTWFGGVGSGTTGSIVFSADQGVDDPAVQAAMTDLFDTIQTDEQFEGISLQSPYDPGNDRLMARQGDNAGLIAYADLSLSFDIDQTESALLGREIESIIEDKGIDEIDGLRVELGGAALGEFEPPESELLGLAFAIFVLILAMGSVVAMGTTIGVAVLGVGIGALLITLLSNLFTVPDFATTIGLMIGLGVGIDYALFIVTRYREALHQGFTPENAVAVALDTAGRSVIFAGLTVVVSLLGMLLIGLAFISGLGIAAAVTVTVVMAASVTLLPAALGVVAEQIETTTWRGMAVSALIALGLLGAGTSVQPFLVGFPLAVIVLIAGLVAVDGNPLRRMLPPRRHVPHRDTVWYRWSRFIQARPWAFAVGATALLLVLAAPLLDLRLGFSDEGNFPEDTTTRQAYDMLAEGFGPGSNGPLLVAVELGSPSDAAALEGLSQAIGAADGVALASPAQPDNPDAPNAAIIQVQPSTSPQDEATEDLVKSLRDDVIPAATEGTTLDVKVTGLVAANIDFTSYLGARILLFFGVVLTLSFLLLMAVFRSLLVPLKAVVMNMLSIGAAYGIVVAVFQWGWGGALFGIDGAPIEPFIPMMLFAIVFGLSMDYEVFLLSRVKEEYERTGDPVNSVADGLAATAQVITAAAAIMIVVFGSFVFEDNRIVKLFGLGLSMAVLIDASLVRMLLVPSTMQLLGARNWWLPGWLDRILPDLNIEGGHHEPPVPAQAESPAPVHL
ncbi:MAG: MMPL family transporter [Actinomycetia bacterium]|nr:MMPL family transporter [Actinomycetes bacterium]